MNDLARKKDESLSPTAGTGFKASKPMPRFKTAMYARGEQSIAIFGRQSAKSE